MQSFSKKKKLLMHWASATHKQNSTDRNLILIFKRGTKNKHSGETFFPLICSILDISKCGVTSHFLPKWTYNNDVWCHGFILTTNVLHFFIFQLGLLSLDWTGSLVCPRDKINTFPKLHAVSVKKHIFVV